MHYAANVSMLWREAADPYGRFVAAAEAGFTRVERLFIHDLDLRRLRDTLSVLSLDMVLFDAYPGDWDRGERGLLFLPGREEEFRDAVRAAVEGAAELGVALVNLLAGIPPTRSPPDEALQTAFRNLQTVAPLAAAAGVSLLIEPINALDVPGYAIPTMAAANHFVRAIGHPAVGIQFDTYHVARSGDDILAAIRAVGDLVLHVQIADSPGRHEPGSGRLPLTEFLRELSTSYQGTIGLEYIPSTTTEESLRWLPRSLRH